VPRVGRGRRRMSSSMHVSLDEEFVSVIRADREVKPAKTKQVFDNPEIVEHLQAPGLQAFALGTNEERGGFVDESEANFAASQIASQRQPGWAGSDDQDLKVIVLHGVWDAPWSVLA